MAISLSLLLLSLTSGFATWIMPEEHSRNTRLLFQAYSLGREWDKSRNHIIFQDKMHSDPRKEKMALRSRCLENGGWKEGFGEGKPSPRRRWSVIKDKEMRISLVHVGKPPLQDRNCWEAGWEAALMLRVQISCRPRRVMEICMGNVFWEGTKCEHPFRIKTPSITENLGQLQKIINNRK